MSDDTTGRTSAEQAPQDTFRADPATQAFLQGVAAGHHAAAFLDMVADSAADSAADLSYQEATAFFWLMVGQRLAPALERWPARDLGLFVLGARHGAPGEAQPAFVLQIPTLTIPGPPTPDQAATENQSAASPDPATEEPRHEHPGQPAVDPAQEDTAAAGGPDALRRRVAGLLYAAARLVLDGADTADLSWSDPDEPARPAGQFRLTLP